MEANASSPSLGGHRRLRLPNGLEIVCQTETEARFFYRDIFVEQIYCRHSVSLDGVECVVDVGANIGLFTHLVAESRPHARIFAFEPAPPLHALLRENVSRYGERVEVFNRGLSNRSGKAELTFYPNSSGLSSFHADEAEERAVLAALMAEEARQNAEGISEVLRHADDLLSERLRAVRFECRLSTLSEIIRERAIEQIDLLKIDAQKSELEVIEGIEDEHWPRIRQIVLELHNAENQFEGLRDLLEGHGFAVRAEEEKAYRGSTMLNVFAVRSKARGGLEVGSGASTTPSEVAFLFPGLGSHYLGMGAGLYEEEPVFRRELDTSAEILEPHLRLNLRRFVRRRPEVGEKPGPDLRRMIRGELGEVVGEELIQTRLAQPVLFAVEMALARLLMARGIVPRAMIGYSIGEYVAACLAGVLSLEDALVLVARRAELIDALPRGGMSAVSLGEEEVLRALPDTLSLSAVNAPELCVVGGPEAELGRFESQLGERGVGFRRLATSHAFHSSMMEPLEESFSELVARVHLSEPRIPYVSNVTGEWIRPEEATDPSYWARHLSEPVRFSRGLERLGVERTLVEVGPGQALGAWVLQHPSTTGRKWAVIATLRHPYDSQSDAEALARAFGKLEAAGHPIAPGSEAPAAALGVAPIVSERAIERTPPRNEIEEAILALWRELLIRDEIGIEESFFEIGGDSLKAARFLARAEEEFDVALPLRELFENPTIERFAAALLAAQAAEVDGELLAQLLGEIEQA